MRELRRAVKEAEYVVNGEGRNRNEESCQGSWIRNKWRGKGKGNEVIKNSSKGS
jgi:hypothetical protein